MIGAVLFDQKNDWTVQHARSTTLEAIAPLRDDLVFMLPTAFT